MNPHFRLSPGPRLELVHENGECNDFTQKPHLALLHPVKVVHGVTFRDLVQLIAKSKELLSLFFVEHGFRLNKLLEPVLSAPPTAAEQMQFRALVLRKTMAVNTHEGVIHTGFNSYEFIGIDKNETPRGLCLTPPQHIVDVPIGSNLGVVLLECDPFSCRDGDLLESYVGNEVTVLQLVMAAVDTLGEMEEVTEDGTLMRDAVASQVAKIESGDAQLSSLALTTDGDAMPQEVLALVHLDTVAKWVTPSGAYDFNALQLVHVFCKHDCSTDEAFTAFVSCPDNEQFTRYLDRVLGAGAYLVHTEIQQMKGREVRVHAHQQQLKWSAND